MTADEMAGNTGVILGEHYRITALTSRLIRMEYAPDGVYENRRTQLVASRDFPAVPCRVWRTEQGGVELHTEHVSLFYDGRPFSPSGLWVENRSECAGIYCTWRFGDSLTENLGGTARTLDGADGPVPLENGIQSRLQGYAVLDDSQSFALTEDGWFAARLEGVRDLYFFGYGYAYREALRDFYHLCGAQPLLPRFALGNWWSRYRAYTAEEYLLLMDQFAQEGVPLSVAVVDMDWHITQPPGGGKGWTGYTWNRLLFPAPEKFLAALHCRGLRVTLNLHPAEGIQKHEEMYAAAAEALERDARGGQRIPFDPANRAFMQVYFDLLHRPREAEGVDFWWIDWQQGATSAMAGLDPLWTLNALHTAHSGRDGKRALILSRYAGLGSHRYPVGFSGDSVISWASLRFQPYFTATAANAGYGWWSHDIGGHMSGKRDDELMVRWLQLGVFSPILRLHNTSNPFCDKEPWHYGTEIRTLMDGLLRLRHRLIPYLYSMNFRAHAQGEPLVQPMYYDYPRQPEAYQVPNQYLFGSELIVGPVTDPMDAEARVAQVKAWLPEGEYFDFMNGLRIQGNREVLLCRALSGIPVLAKAGAIIPLAGDNECNRHGAALPAALEVRVYGGADGAFDLYEDDGETMAYADGAFAITRFALDWRAQGGTRFRMDLPQAQPYLPEARDIDVLFMGVAQDAKPAVTISGCAADTADTRYEPHERTLTVPLRDLPWGAHVALTFDPPLMLADNDVPARCLSLVREARIAYELKAEIALVIGREAPLPSRCGSLLAIDMPTALRNALLEIMLACS